jgi:hypothetical protein
MRPVRGTTPPLGVRDTARGEHEPPGAGLEVLVADSEDVLPFEHVEQLVLVLVNVERGVDGFVLLEDRECSARGVGGSFDDDLHIAEPQALSAFGLELVRRGTSPQGHDVVSSIR